MKRGNGFSTSLSLFLIVALLMPHVARAAAPLQPERILPRRAPLAKTAGPTAGSAPSAASPVASAPPEVGDGGLPPAVASTPSLGLTPVAAPGAARPAGPWLGRLLFAPAIDADGQPATNPVASSPVPVVKLAGEVGGIVVLAAQLEPEDPQTVPVGIPVTFRVWDAERMAFERTVRSDAWGAASVEVSLVDVEAEYAYQASAPGYALTEVRRFRFDPDQVSFSLHLDGAQLSHQTLQTGEILFTVRSPVPLQAGRDGAALHIVRRPLDEAVWGKESATGSLLEALDVPETGMPFPSVDMQVIGHYTATVAVRLPAGDYGIVASVAVGASLAEHYYSQRVGLLIERMLPRPETAAGWASGLEYEPGRRLIRYHAEAGHAAFGLVPADQVPEIHAEWEDSTTFVKTWRTGPFQWREESYQLSVEPIVDDGKKIVTLQGFDYDPMARRYTLAIRSLHDEAITDTLRVDVLGPGAVVIMHEERGVVLEPGKILYHQVEVPAELGRPEGLRVTLDDPIDTFVRALWNAGTTLASKLAERLSMELKFYVVVLGWELAEYKCTHPPGTCQGQFKAPNAESIVKNLFKDMMTNAQFVLGMLALDDTLNFTADFEPREGDCPIPSSEEEIKNRIDQLAIDINNILDAMKLEVGKATFGSPKIPIFWFLSAWLEISAFIRGTAARNGMVLTVGVQAGVSIQGKVGFALWGGSLQGIWGLITLMTGLVDLVMLADKVEKLEIDDECDDDPPDEKPPDDRQDIWQGFEGSYIGQTHDETVNKLVGLIERAQAQNLWRAERLLALELREAEWTRLTADRTSLVEYVDEADAIILTAQADLEGILSGTVPISPSQTITEAWGARAEQAYNDLEALDYAHRQEAAMDALDAARRQYEELYGQELELQHELYELLLAETVGVLASGFAEGTLEALAAVGLPAQLISARPSNGWFRGQRAPYVAPDLAPPALVVPAGGLGAISRSPEAQAWLEEYVAGGGLLIVFTQAFGEYWAALPGGEVAGVGYEEDQRCQHASVEAARASDWLVWMGVQRPDIQVDGAFTAWPDDANVLLRRTQGAYAGYPVMIEYGHGQGRVLATTAYGDWAFQTASWWGDDWQMTRSVFLRAWLLARGQDVGDVVSADPNSTINVSFPLSNTSAVTTTAIKVVLPAKLHFYRWRQFADTVPLSIMPGDSAMVAASVPTPPVMRGVHKWTLVGLYRLEVRAYEGQRVAFDTWGPVVYVRSPIVPPELTVDLEAERGKANLSETLAVTATVSSRADAGRTVVLRPQRDLPTQPVTLTVPAQGQVAQVYAVQIDSSKTPAVRLETEGGDPLGAATTAIRLQYPQLRATPRIPLALSDGSAISLTVSNRGTAAALAGSVALTLTSPAGTPQWTAGQALPPLEAGESVTLPFTLSLPPEVELGTYHLWHRVDDGRGLTRASRVPLPATLDISQAFEHTGYRVREPMAFTTTLRNVGRFDLALQMTVTVPTIGYSETRSPSLAAGESASFPFSPTLPYTLTAGAYAVVVEARQSSTISDRSTFVVAPSQIEAALEPGPYLAGEALTVTLSNAGGADTTVDYELRLSDMRRDVAQKNSSVLIQAGGSVRVPLSIPAQAATGSSYLAKALTHDQQTGRDDGWVWPLALEGIAATVDASTEQPAYLAGETITATGGVSLTSGALVSAPLTLEVVNGMLLPQVSANEQVAPSTGQYYRRDGPSLAVDPTGNAYAVWVDRRNEGIAGDIYFAYRPVTTDTWGVDERVNDALDGAVGQGAPSIAVDAAGNAYAVWQDTRNFYSAIYSAYRPAGGEWSADELVKDDIGWPHEMNPAIAVDPDGNAYAVWEDHRTGNHDIYFAYRPVTGTWGADVKVSDDSGTADQRMAAITVDAAGNAYAVWQDERNGDWDIYSAYRPVTGTWGTNVRVNDDGGTAEQRLPAITVDAAGNAYAAWEDQRNGNWDIYHAPRTGMGTWGSNELVINNDTSDQTRASIAVDAIGDVLAVWRDARWWDGIGDIFFARRDSTGTWNGGYRITDDSGATYQNNPVIAVDPARNAQILWVDGRNEAAGYENWEIWSDYRIPSGTFGPEVRVNDDASGPTEQQHPAVAVAPDGEVYAVWAEDGSGIPAVDLDIYFAARSAGGTWGAAVKVSDDAGSSTQEDPAIASDALGNAYATWHDERSGTRDDIYSSCRSVVTGTWETNEKVNDDTPTYGWKEQPDIAVDPAGNAYAVWYDDRLYDESIYFAYRPVTGTWETNLRVTDAGDNWLEMPAVAVDVSGNAVAVWLDYRLDWKPEIYSAYRPAGGNWGANVMVNDAPGEYANTPDVAMDAAGNAQAVWMDQRDYLGVQIYSAYRPAGGSWEPNVRVDDDPEGWHKGLDRTAIAVDAEGNAFAVWADQREWQEIYLAYRPAGGRWGTNLRVDDGSLAPDQDVPDVAMDANGNAHVVWVDERDGPPRIYYARVTPGGPFALWTHPLTVTSSTTWPFSETVGTLNERVGKHTLRATLTNDLGQTLAVSEYPFYVHPLSVTLTMATDRDYYRRGQTAEISGRVTNTTAVSATIPLTLTADEHTVLTDTFQLDPDEGAPYATTLVVTESVVLLAQAGPAQVFQQVTVAEPQVEAALEAPSVVGRDPFTVTLVLTNTGLVSAALEADFAGQATRAATLEAGEGGLLQASLSITDSTVLTVSISGDASLTLTHPISQGEAATVALVDGEANQRAGLAAVPFTINGAGSLPARVELSATLHSGVLYTHTQSLLILPGQVYSDELSLEVPEGEHPLTVVLLDVQGNEMARQETTLWAMEAEAPEEPDASPTAVDLWPQPAGPGSAVSVTLALRNEGAAGQAVAALQAFQVEQQTVVTLTDALSQSLALTLSVPTDAPTGTYYGQASVDGRSQPFTLTVSGVDLGLGLALDRTWYLSGEVASLVATLTENAGLSREYNLSLRYLDAEEYVTVTVPAGQVVQHTFHFTATETGRATVFLAYTPSNAGQRIITIDSLPVEVAQPEQGVYLTSDNQVYDAGETIHLTLNITGTPGSVMVMGPMELMWREGDFLLWRAPFDWEVMGVVSGTHALAYTLPVDLNSGQYTFVVQADGETLEHRVDVLGWRVTTRRVTLDKPRYAAQDTLSAVVEFVNEGVAPIQGLTLGAWVAPPGDEPGLALSPPVSRTVNLKPGLNVFTVTGGLNTPYAGPHRLVVNVGVGCCGWRVAGAAAQFDVGWAHLVALRTDKGDYQPAEPGEGYLDVYGHGPTTLVVTDTNDTILLNVQRDLSGYETLTFSIPTTPTGDYLLVAHGTDQNGNTDSLFRAYAVPGPRDMQAPDLVLTYPGTETVITAVAPTTTLTVLGNATDDSGQVTVLVNGEAVTPAVGGDFSLPLEVQQGVNLVSAAAIDPSGNITYTPIVPVYLLPPHGLTFSANLSQAQVGQQVTFQAVLTSSGVMSGVSLVQPLPSELVTDVVALASAGSATVVGLDPLWPTVNWVGDLQAGQPVTVTVQATVVATGTLTQMATVYWGWGFMEDSNLVEVTLHPLTIWVPLVLRGWP